MCPPKRVTGNDFILNKALHNSTEFEGPRYFRLSNVLVIGPLHYKLDKEDHSMNQPDNKGTALYRSIQSFCDGLLSMIAKVFIQVMVRVCSLSYLHGTLT